MSKFAQLRKAKSADISKLTEIVQRGRFIDNLKLAQIPRPSSQTLANFEASTMTGDNLKSVIKSGMLTFLLHCEARIASNIGMGYYTIGPCGEELLAATTLHLRPTDACALHYRHVSNAVLRQLLTHKSVEDIALDRARGFTCSTLDPITGGKHCSIGGGPFDYLVTSTLASQAPPAVGRALGIALSNHLLGDGKAPYSRDAISYVSLGDGSVNNAHFLAALNLSKYAAHRRMKCPVVFVISDNKKCISLKGHGWIDEFVKNSGMKHEIADGTDVVDVFNKSREVMTYSRKMSKPSILLCSKLPRRFGYAATDRQSAYM